MYHSVTSLTIITIAWKLHFISGMLCIVQIVTVIWLTLTRLLLFSAHYIERQLLVFVTHVGRLFIHKIRIVICYTFKRLCYIQERFASLVCVGISKWKIIHPCTGDTCYEYCISLCTPAFCYLIQLLSVTHCCVALYCPGLSTILRSLYDLRLRLVVWKHLVLE